MGLRRSTKALQIFSLGPARGKTAQAARGPHFTGDDANGVSVEARIWTKKMFR